MTASQRFRLAIALGTLNLVLAGVAIGLFAVNRPTQEVAGLTANPTATVPDVARSSEKPPGSPGPGLPPESTPESTPTPSTEPSSEPATGTPGGPTGLPPSGPQTGPVGHPTDTPGALPSAPAAALTQEPTAAPASEPTVAPTAPTVAPTAMPTVAPTKPPVGRPSPGPITRPAHPPCPGTVDGAPGLNKGSGDDSGRPCRGGEGQDHKGGQTGTDDRIGNTGQPSTKVRHRRPRS